MPTPNASNDITSIGGWHRFSTICHSFFFTHPSIIYLCVIVKSGELVDKGTGSNLGSPDFSRGGFRNKWHLEFSLWTRKTNEESLNSSSLSCSPGVNKVRDSVIGTLPKSLANLKPGRHKMS